jgi:hypothetical protein
MPSNTQEIPFLSALCKLVEHHHKKTQLMKINNNNNKKGEGDIEDKNVFKSLILKCLKFLRFRDLCNLSLGSYKKKLHRSVNLRKL